MKTMYHSFMESDYEEKVIASCGLKNDPYVIEDGWEESPEIIPEVCWSDLTMYMVSTPSPHNKDNLKVYYK